MECNLRIAHLTDIHMDDYLLGNNTIDGKNNLKVITKDISIKNIDKIVITGDMGNPDLFDWIIETIKETGLEYTYVLGNHDKLENFAHRTDVKHQVKKSGLFYHLERESELFFFLDSSSSKIDPFQEDWIETILAETKSKKVIVFVHYPVLNCGNTTMDRLYPLLNRDLVKGIFSISGKEIYIFSGHYHTAAEVTDKNIKQYVTPSSVLQFKKYSDELELETKQFGYRIIDISKDEINTEIVLFNP